MTNLICKRCEGALTNTQRYCGQCGCSTQKKSKKFYLSLIIASIGLCGVLLITSSKLIGNKPTEKIVKTEIPTKETSAESVSNSDVEGLTKRAYTIIDALASGSDDKELVLEALDALSKVVKADPKNSWALLQLAELSFVQQVFDKAANYYEKYLLLVPNDDSVRARYAGSLNFIGKSKEAVVQLEPLHQKDPNNFQTLGYLAVSYAQSGNVVKAKEVGKLALAKAPDEAARARFSSFVEKLGEKPAETKATSTSVSQNKSDSTQVATVDLKILDTYLKNHPIAGRMFLATEQKGDTIILKFNNFPMQAMPEMVRNKFVTNVMQQLPKDSNLKLRFVEGASGEVLYEQ